MGYSFSLPIELLLVFFMTILVLSIELSQSKDELASVRRLFEWIVACCRGIRAVESRLGPSGTGPTSSSRRRRGAISCSRCLLTVGSIPFLYRPALLLEHRDRPNSDGPQDLSIGRTEAIRKKTLFPEVPGAGPKLLLRAARQFHSLPAETTDDVDQIVVGCSCS